MKGGKSNVNVKGACCFENLGSRTFRKRKLSNGDINTCEQSVQAKASTYETTLAFACGTEVHFAFACSMMSPVFELYLSHGASYMSNLDVRIQEWDDEQAPSLRRYFSLRTEADEEVAKSKVVWPDTPFSVYAVQCV